MRYHHGQIIRMYRQQRGISQTELADHWPRADGMEGVNTRYVQDIEYGKKQIADPGTLRKLAAVLSIPLWRFGLSEYDPFYSSKWSNPYSLDALQDRAETQLQQPVTEQAQHISPVYYERMLRAYTQAEPLLFAWTMWNLSLPQLSSQLSSLQVANASITIFKCSAPAPSVRSLYEIARHGRCPPQTLKLRFYGRESLAGQAVQDGKTILAGKNCALPIMRRQRAGACLLVQAQSDIGAMNVEIIQRYADLFALAFAESEFYPSRMIDLYTIPAEINQDILLQEFDLQRLDPVSLHMTDPLCIPRAEQLILRSIQAEKPGSINTSAKL
ncbi:MAG TPA: helix-turn-helix transcriptional regulator [Ktedonobacteraceae bacterium]